MTFHDIDTLRQMDCINTQTLTMKVVHLARNHRLSVLYHNTLNGCHFTIYTQTKRLGCTLWSRTSDIGSTTMQ